MILDKGQDEGLSGQIQKMVKNYTGKDYTRATLFNYLKDPETSGMIMDIVKKYQHEVAPIEADYAQQLAIKIERAKKIRNDRSGIKRLSDSQILELQRLYKDGEPINDIAKKMGVSRATVMNRTADLRKKA